MKKLAIILIVAVIAFRIFFPPLHRPQPEPLALQDDVQLGFLATTLSRYASAHEGRYPANLDDLAASGSVPSGTLFVPSVTQCCGRPCTYVYVPGRSSADSPPRVLLYPPIDVFRKHRPGLPIGVLFSDGSARRVNCDALEKHVATGNPVSGLLVAHAQVPDREAIAAYLATGRPLSTPDTQPTIRPTPTTEPAASSQPHSGDGDQEWFVGVQEAIARPPLVRQLIRMDPLTGKITVLMERKDSSHMPNVNLLDARGRHLGVNSMTLAGEEQPRIVVVGAGDGEPIQVFRALRVPVYARMALSPDGLKLACFDLVTYPNRLMMEHNGKLHEVPTSWWMQGRPFSWNRDSTQVAFYYSDDLNDDDIHIQKHGLAVLSVEGVLRSLIPPDEKTKTPESTCKYIPPGWGRSGRYVYYTAALAPDDPDRAGEAVRSLVAIRNGTHRIEVATGKIEKLGLGDFYCVSPNEEYVLMYPAARRTEDGKWKYGTSKVDLKSRKVTHLPANARSPILSPSGRLAACSPNDPDYEVTFFKTDDWTPYGRPIQLNRKRPLLCGEAWISHCRWIVPDGDKIP